MEIILNSKIFNNPEIMDLLNEEFYCICCGGLDFIENHIESQEDYLAYSDDHNYDAKNAIEAVVNFLQERGF
jgi:hypothetical protein